MTRQQGWEYLFLAADTSIKLEHGSGSTPVHPYTGKNTTHGQQGGQFPFTKLYQGNGGTGTGQGPANTKQDAAGSAQ